jgi:hypothetical protein
MESFIDELPKADLARNGVRASFLDVAAKQALLDEIDEVASRPGPDVLGAASEDASAHG